MNVNKPSEQAIGRECLPGQRFVQRKKHAEKKVLLAGFFIPLLRSQKTLQQRNTIPNSTEAKELKEMNNAGIIFNLEGKTNLI